MKNIKLQIASVLLLTLVTSLHANEQEPQWYFLNKGQSIPVDIEDLTTEHFNAVPGEDLNFTNLPVAPKKEVLVAILDTGIQTDHPELAPYIATKPSECEALKAHLACLKEAKLDKPKIILCEKSTGIVDTDGNGYPLDCTGFNFTAKEGDGTRGSFNVQDHVGHGTHLAGIVSASGKMGVARGVATGFVKLLPVKVMGGGQAPNGPLDQGQGPLRLPTDDELAKQKGFVTTITRGIRYAIVSGAKVINISIGWPGAIDPNQKQIKEVLEYAQANGVMIVSAAGNDSTNQPILPCAYTQVICVASNSPDGSVSHFSNFGSLADIAAPGYHILSTWPMALRPKKYYIRPGYEYKNGTSMAAPFVAGTLAVMLSQDMQPTEAFARLLLGVSSPKVSVFQTWQDKTLLSGNLDIGKSLTLSAQPMIYPVKQEDIKLLWNRVNPNVTGKVDLTNLWLDATNVTFKVTRMSDGLVLDTLPASIATWAFKEQHQLLFKYPVESAQSGEDQVKVEISSNGKEISSYQLQVQVMVPSSALLIPNQTGVRVFDIKDVVLAEGETYRSIDNSPDFLIVRTLNRNWSIRRLTRENETSYKITAQEEFAIGDAIEKGDIESSLIRAEERDLDRDGKPDLALFFKVDSVDGKDAFRGTEIQYRNAQLKPLRAFGEKSSITLNSKITTLPESYSWGLLNGFERLFFKGMGDIPPLDMPKPTKREPKPQQNRSFHIYYLGQDGLRMIPDPTDILALTTFDDQVLYLKGNSFDNFHYVTQKISDLVQGKNIETPVNMSQFRLLEGLETPKLFTNDKGLKAFAGPALPGQQKVTFIHSTDPRVASQDFVLSPVNRLDSLIRVVGTKFTEERKEVFAQSQYDLVYKNLVTNQTYAVSANRFSFLPSLLFEGFFFPIEVGGKLAVYSPSYNLNGAVEVILAGETGLVKPARLRVYVSGGCKEQNFRQKTASTPAQAIFICDNKIVELDLN